MGNCFGVRELRKGRDEGSRIPDLLVSGLRVYLLLDVTDAFVLVEPVAGNPRRLRQV